MFSSNITSKQTFEYDSDHLLTGYKRTFNADCVSSTSCFGGGNLGLGAILGSLAGGVLTGALMGWARGKGGGLQNGGLRLGGISSVFGGGYGMGGNGFGGGALGGIIGSIFGNGYGMSPYGSGGYTGMVDPLNNPYAVALDRVKVSPLQEGGAALGKPKAEGADDPDSKNNNGNAVDKKKKEETGKPEDVDPSKNKKNPEGGQESVKDKSKKQETTNDKSKPQNGGNNGNIVGINDFDSLSDADKAKAKERGNALTRAVNDLDTKDGTTVKTYSGIFESGPNKANVENGATLKYTDENQARKFKIYSDRKGNIVTEDATTQDYRDAVKIGNSKGDESTMATDPMTGAPQYFTMTDYRSSNQYTFRLYGFDTKTGKLQYKIDKDGSNLGVDNDVRNRKDWEFIKGAENLIFEVEINEDNQEIELTHNGQKVSYNAFARKK